MDREPLLTARVLETNGRKSVAAATRTENGTECANARVVGIRVV